MAWVTTSDVTIRLEESALSVEEAAAASALIDTATAIICEAAGKLDDTWFDVLPPTRQNLLKGLTVELVCRAMASPQGLTSAKETLGAYAREEYYRRDLSSALLLTEPEADLVARLAGRPRSGSVPTESLVHDIYQREA